MHENTTHVVHLNAENAFQASKINRATDWSNLNSLEKKDFPRKKDLLRRDLNLQTLLVR